MESLQITVTVKLPPNSWEVAGAEIMSRVWAPCGRTLVCLFVLFSSFSSLFEDLVPLCYWISSFSVSWPGAALQAADFCLDYVCGWFFSLSCILHTNQARFDRFISSTYGWCIALFSTMLQNSVYPLQSTTAYSAKQSTELQWGMLAVGALLTGFTTAVWKVHLRPPWMKYLVSCWRWYSGMSWRLKR